MRLAVVAMTVASAPSFRQALCQALTPMARVNVPHHRCVQCRGDSRTPDASFCMCILKLNAEIQNIESSFKQKFASRMTTMLTWSNCYHTLSTCEQFIFSQGISAFFFKSADAGVYISSLYWPITIISYSFKFCTYVSWFKLIYKTKSNSERFAYD